MVIAVDGFEVQLDQQDEAIVKKLASDALPWRYDRHSTRIRQRIPAGKSRYQYRLLHRVIAARKLHRELTHQDRVSVRNGNYLDMRRRNIIIRTFSGQARMVQGRRGASSQYPGVHYIKSRNRWRARYWWSDEQGQHVKHLGEFVKEIDAHKARVAYERQVKHDARDRENVQDAQ